MAQAGDQRYHTLTLDTDRYQAMLDAPDLSDAQKSMLVETLWNVVLGFIDLNVEVQTVESCGQAQELCNPVPKDAVPVVNSSIPATKVDFGKAAFSAANTPHSDKEAS